MQPYPTKAYMLFKHRHAEDLRRAQQSAQLQQDQPQKPFWLAWAQAILRFVQPHEPVLDPAPSDALTPPFDHIPNTA